jgi:MoaA/NifB/PqqE/SkfB family radical SAM enzyme
MFKFNELKQIHLEITNNCQASCPQCQRNIHGGLENHLIKITDWTLAQFKSIMTEDVLKQIDKYYFCGNFGDPLLNNDLIPMIEYSAEVNPDLDIWIYTNGSLRSKDWWRQLAKSLPKKHKVVFAIDGLEDTHSIYRVGTNFDKIIDNAYDFIQAGGRAEWSFIRFKHNEHQVDEVRKLANDLGFESFTIKDSGRFMFDRTFPVYDQLGNTTRYLEPSGYSEIKFIDRNAIDNFQKIVEENTINCNSIEHREIYIDAYGQVFPCCYLGITPYIPTDTVAGMTQIRSKMLSQHHVLIKALGGSESQNAGYRSIKDIINSDSYQTTWQNFWNNKKLIMCVAMCGTSSKISKPKEMFVERSSLDSTRIS